MGKFKLTLKMASLDVVRCLFVLCLYATIAQTEYIPATAHTIQTTQENVRYSVLCPNNCNCLHENMTAQCVFSYSNYAVGLVSPWKLTRLSIHGDDRTWKSEFASRSVMDVLLKGHSKLPTKPGKIWDWTFSGLLYLDISYIPINMISNEDFMDMADLTTLTLSFNNISTIESNTFHGLSNLKELNLDGNKMSTIQKGLFSSLRLLKSLSIRGNGLKVLKSKHLEGLVSLESLNLQNNVLRQIETLLLELNGTTLHTLNLRGNEISYFLEDSVNKLLKLSNVDISANRLECTCNVQALFDAYMSRRSLFDGDILCNGPPGLAGVNLKDLDRTKLPCDNASIVAISDDTDTLYHANMVLDCTAAGDAPLVVYWITPWGDKFTRKSNLYVFPDQLKNMKTNETYYAMNLLIWSTVFVSQNDSLVIQVFRGVFAGDYTCVAENLLGSSKASVSVGVHTVLHGNYLTSLLYGGSISIGLLVIIVISGLVRLCVNSCCQTCKCSCCCCCEYEEIEIVDIVKVLSEQGIIVPIGDHDHLPGDYESLDEHSVEVTYADSENTGTGIEYMDGDMGCMLPPDPPVNSPMAQISPDGCHTPDDEPASAHNPAEPSQHILEQLDEVRTRLRSGAGRKMKKVRAQVRSFTDTGSLKIRNIKDASSIRLQSMKDSGSAAASTLKKNMASGMIQVKYGVQSIKELCGTGEMGPGAISMVSMSTDVDTTETAKIVRSHTIV